jgi:hypothetical protein
MRPLTLMCWFGLGGAGTSADEDIVVSSAKAYTSALNKMIGWLSAASASSSSVDAETAVTVAA